MSVYHNGSLIPVSDAAAITPGNATYANVRNLTTATTASPASPFTLLGQMLAAGSYSLGQYFLTFNTSSIPVGITTANLSIQITTTSAITADTLEVREVSSTANLIAGTSLAATTPLLGSKAIPAADSGRINIPLDISAMSRSATTRLVVHSQKQRLGTAPATTDEGIDIATLANATAGNRPFMSFPGSWQFVGISTQVEATTTAITLTEPAGVADGDLLIATIASRTTATTAVTNTGWTAVGSQNTNNTLSTASAIASGTMLYQIRAGTPDLTFVIPAGISIAVGRIVAYRGSATTPLDVTTAVTTATGTTAVSVAGLTTTQDDDLIVAMCAGGQEAAFNTFNATDPSGATTSGLIHNDDSHPVAKWLQRGSYETVTNVDTSLYNFDAIKTVAGATGNLTATASVSAGHVVIAGAFKIAPPPTADAWNYADKSANITLSASDKTATGGGGGATVQSTQKYTNETAGKYYAEFKIEVKAGTDHYGIQPDSSLAGTLTGAITVSGFNGAIQIAGSGTTPTVGATPVANDIVCMAWDSGSERIWFRLNGGNWNNDASADPATGTNGFDISATVGAVSTALLFYTGGAGSSGTLRTELAEFTQAVPSGFRSWMGEVNGPGTLVQSNEGVGTTATTTATFSTAPTAGNLVVLAFAADDYNGTPNSGWTQSAEMEVQTYHGGYLWWRISDGTNSFPYTIDSAVNSVWILQEFSGVANDAYDTSQGKGGPTSGGTATSDAIVPTAGNRMLVAMRGGSSGSSMSAVTSTWSNSFTKIQEIGASTGTTKDWVGTVYRLVTGDGSTGFTTTSDTAPFSPDSQSVLIIAFKTNAAFSADKTVTAVAGSYAVTGTAASLERGREVEALSGSYALTGQPVTLSKVVSYRLASDAGSYALSGATAGLYRGREVLAVAGSYGLTGTVASLETGREVTADGGSYALTGATTGLELGREVLALSASYAIGGATATLSHGWKVAAVAGSYTLTGTAATLTKGAAIVHRTLPADAGAYALSGATAGLEPGREVLALGGSYALSGATASLECGREALALGGSYALTGATASFRQTRLTSAVSGSYALTGQPATFARTWKATALGGTYALTGLPVNLLKPGAYAVIGLPGAYALTGTTVGLEWNREVPALAGSYALAGSAASLEKGREVVADAGAYALTGSPATPIHAVARTVVADGGAYALTGSPAVLTYSGAAPAAYRSIAGTSYALRSLETVCDAPAGVIDGDILIAGVFAGQTLLGLGDVAELDITPPSGWTQIGTDTEVFAGGFGASFQIYWKRAASEGATYTFSHTGSGSTQIYSTQAAIAAYSGCVPTGDPVDVFSQTAANIGSTATATGITPEYTLTKLVYLGHNWDATGALTPPAGTTERFDNLVYLSDEDRTGSGRTGDRTQALASSNPWAAFLIALKSAVSVFTRLVDATAGSYALTGAEDVILEKTVTGVVSTRSGRYGLVGAEAVVGHGLFAHGGVYTIVGADAVLEIGVEAVEPPVTPIIGGAGGSIPRKQLRRAVRELLRREEKRKGRKKPKVLAREILEAVEPEGLGVREKRIAIRLIGEALRLELPSLLYPQPLIHDKERIARAILFLVRQAMQRLLDEEEDEEAALLLLSAA